MKIKCPPPLPAWEECPMSALLPRLLCLEASHYIMKHNMDPKLMRWAWGVW